MATIKKWMIHGLKELKVPFDCDGRLTYYGYYSDGMVSEDKYKTLNDAVRAFARDVIGHTLACIKDMNGTVVWTIESGYNPASSQSERAIENPWLS